MPRASRSKSAGSAASPDNLPSDAFKAESVHDHTPPLGPNGLKWYHSAKAKDPVFSDARTEQAFVDSLQLPMQPYDHAKDDMFPTAMESFGFERFDPTSVEPSLRKKLVSAKEGIASCSKAAGGSTGKCQHQHHLPAFLYT